MSDRFVPGADVRERRRSRRPRGAAPKVPVRRLALDLSAMVVLLAVPVVGFGPSFDGPGFLVAGFGGVALGLAIAWAGMRFRLGALEIIGATAVAYFVFGGALALPHTTIAGFVPTGDTIVQLAVGVVQSWKKLLTTVAPVAAGDGHLIVPFLLALVVSIVSGTLALRVRTPAWALAPAVVFLAAEIALGVSQPALPVVQGIVFAVVAIVWLSARAALDHTDAAVSLGEAPDRSAVVALRVRRAVTAVVLIAIAVGGGAATGALAAPPSTRYVLRDVVIPPFDVRAYPSPLQSFRGMVRDDASATLFTATGLPKDARVRLATMDAYSGIVYEVSDEGAGSSSAFTPVRTNMSPGATGTPVTVRFDIQDLTGVWLPDAGAVRELSFEGARADALRRSAHYNDATGTAVATAGVQKGDAYTLQGVIPAQPSDEQLDGVPYAPLALPKVTGVPDKLSELAADATADAKTPIQQVRGLESWLHTQGFFSHGLEGQPLSPSGHGQSRIASLIGGKQMVGDDEQYAVTMALAARGLGIPARVVMGWHPDADAEGEATPGGVFTATGDNLHAWVEVAFQGHGWVAFDPTPPKNQVPTDQTTKPKANPKPQVLQPPPPPQEPAAVPPTVADAREKKDDLGNVLAWLVPVLVGTGIGLLVLALLAAPFVAIAVLKARRRSRRLAAERGADRVTGGWEELLDHAVDLDVPVTAGATRTESALVMASTFDAARVGAVATRADADVFGPGDPGPDEVAAFWREVDDIVGAHHAELSRWRRLRARFNPISLLPLTTRARIAQWRESRRRRSARTEPVTTVRLVEHPASAHSAPVVVPAPIAVPAVPVRAEAGRRRAAPPVPVIVWDDGAWTAISGRVIFGRNPSPEEGATLVRVADGTLSLSKTHFALEQTDRGLDLVDRNSTNGVLVERGRATTEAPGGQAFPLLPGDVLVLGERRARVDLASLDELTGGEGQA